MGRDCVAYQVSGEGPIDLVYLSNLGDCIDLRWDLAPYANFLRRLGRLARIIHLDKRGQGGSDPVPLEASTWEVWADDIRVVMDAVGSRRAAIMGGGDAGPLALLFAATQPDRTEALVLFHTAACNMRAPDYPWGPTTDDLADVQAIYEQDWGSDRFFELVMPDAAVDPSTRSQASRDARLACTPTAAAAHVRWVLTTDVRAALPSVTAPTLVLQRERNHLYPVEQAQDLVARLPNARLVVIPGRDMLLWGEPHTESVGAIEEFLTGARSTTSGDRALAAVLFTDVVQSTEKAAALGDDQWRRLLEAHYVIAQTTVAQHGGRLIQTTGDGVLATFDGPGRAIRCAHALRDSLHPLGLEIRSGLHAGEVEYVETGVAGLAIHVAARILDLAGPGEVLTSAAVPLLVAGSGLAFDDRGEYQLKGVPGSWQVFAVNG